MTKLNKGACVVFNRELSFDESVYKKVWEVATDEFNVCGTMCVMLKGYPSCVDVNGLTDCYVETDPDACAYSLCKGRGLKECETCAVWEGLEDETTY